MCGSWAASEPQHSHPYHGDGTAPTSGANEGECALPAGFTRTLVASLPSPHTSPLLLWPGVPAWSSSPRCLLSLLPHLLPEFVQIAPCLRGLPSPLCSSPSWPLFPNSVRPLLTCRETLSSTCLSLSFLLENKPHMGRSLVGGPHVLKSQPRALTGAGEL